MDAKYIGLLCRVKDRATRDILTEMLKDAEEDRRPKSPLQRLGQNLEMIEKYRRAQSEGPKIIS